MAYHSVKHPRVQGDIPPAEFCVYPPLVAADVDVTERLEGGEVCGIVRRRPSSRYFLLRHNEYQLFCDIDGCHTVVELAGQKIAPGAVVRFLSKLDSLGVLARGGGNTRIIAHQAQSHLYRRIHLFNPDRLLERLDRLIGWAFTAQLILLSFVLIFIVAIALSAKAPEVASYTRYVFGEYGLVLILLFVLGIAVSHELAHGLACKHFGGEVRDVGVLVIFYILPAFYCNTTDMYRFERKSRRLWVIFAGIYWQLVIGAGGALVWLIAVPQTVMADFAFILFLAGTFNLLINCNPLVKLDGYYALSQVVAVPNLQKTAFGYFRHSIERFIRIAAAIETPRQRRLSEKRAFLVAYCCCSAVYSVVLVWLILGWVGPPLMEYLGFAGVLITVSLAFLFTKNLWLYLGKGILNIASLLYRRIIKSYLDAVEGARTMSESTALEKTDSALAVKPGEVMTSSGQDRGVLIYRRRKTVIKIALAVIALAILIAPWDASSGSDCSLVLPPGRESAARAGADAVLTDIYVRPGDVVAEGGRLARLASSDIEDRLTQLNGEIVSLEANGLRLQDELRVRNEMTLSASLKERERQTMATELRAELSQVASANEGIGFPASLAVLQSDVELKQVKLSHNRLEVQRYKKLLEQDLIGAQQYDLVANTANVSEKELEQARARLQSALVEHRRLANSIQTSSLVAETEARAARSNFEALIADIHANRMQLESIKHRRDILQREFESLDVKAPRSGVVLGDDLQKLTGRRYSRGEEIIRVGELSEFVLRVEVSEREVASVRPDSPVRFKLKTLPGRTFFGRVSKIEAEAALDQYGHRFYPVEVYVENSEGVLRPGMSGFARISFGRKSIGLILAERLWNGLRPELWLF